MKKLSSLLLLSLAITGCAADDAPTMTKDEARQRAIDGKADHIDWCEAYDWYGDGICDEFCLDPDPDCTIDNECFVGGCSGQVCSDQPGVITTCEFLPWYACYQDASCERQADGECGFTVTEEIAECLAPEPDECPDGTLVDDESFFVDSSDDKQCEIKKTQCVTNDWDGCPLIHPRPPNWCADGTVVQGAPSFVSAGNGMVCDIPSAHCVTNDWSACPQIGPLPPDFCADGTVVHGAPRFMSSSDGLECQMPNVHCVTNDELSCPAPGEPLCCDLADIPPAFEPVECCESGQWGSTGSGSPCADIGLEIGNVCE